MLLASDVSEFFCMVIFNLMDGFLHPASEVREGNVFTSVFPSVILSTVGGGSPCDHYPWCIGTWDLPPSPPQRYQTWDLSHPHPTQYWHLVLATETRTVGKRAIRILLECILVSPAAMEGLRILETLPIYDSFDIQPCLASFLVIQHVWCGKMYKI